jgi:hypothetical protein
VCCSFQNKKRSKFKSPIPPSNFFSQTPFPPFSPNRSLLFQPSPPFPSSFSFSPQPQQAVGPPSSPLSLSRCQPGPTCRHLVQRLAAPLPTMADHTAASLRRLTPFLFQNASTTTKLSWLPPPLELHRPTVPLPLPLLTV